MGRNHVRKDGEAVIGNSAGLDFINSLIIDFFKSTFEFSRG